MRFCFARLSPGTMGLFSLLLGLGCAEAEQLRATGGTSGRLGSGGAGSSGAAGSSGNETGGSSDSETGGSSGTGATGSGGAGGFSGRGGSSGTTAGSGAAGSGGSTAGRGGSAGTTGGNAGSTVGGTGGAGGSAGSMGGSGGSTAGGGGVGGTGGATDGGSTTDGSAGVEGGIGACLGTVAYCNDFERDTAGAMPVGWTRVGGSDGDWGVLADTSNVFAQNHASSSTFRLCYAGGAIGAPWSGPTSVSARVKILALGSSGTTTAFLCMGYASSGANYACLALGSSGAQIRINAGTTGGPLWSGTIAVGTWYDAKLSADVSGVLSAYLDGQLLGSYTPASPVASGYVAVATQSAQAAFDTVMVTQP